MQQHLIQVHEPHNFELIPKLFLRGLERNTPYRYLLDEWSCMIPIDEKQIPVLVLPNFHHDKFSLQLKIYDDLSTSETKKILEIIRISFNTDLELSSFYKLALSDRKLRKTIMRLQGLKPFFSVNPYHSLIRTVIRQLVSAQAALGMMSSLVTELGPRCEFDGRVFYGMPSPEKLAKASKSKLLKCKVGYKWNLIRRLARDMISGDLDLISLQRKSDEYIVERLMEYPGIGDWTARTFLFDGFGRHDSYPIYDITVVKAISNLYHQSKQIGKDEVDQFFERYADFRGLAITYLFGSIWISNN